MAKVLVITGNVVNRKNCQSSKFESSILIAWQDCFSFRYR